jgi:hypothetical protein
MAINFLATRLFGTLLASALAATVASASSTTLRAGDEPAHSFEQIFLELEPLSKQTRRRQINTLESPALVSPVELSVFTRLRRSKSAGRQGYSNATLIAGGHCYWIASAAGHSVLDQRYSRIASRGDIEVMLPNGSWANPIEMAASEALNWNSGEVDDWALLVLLAPRCAFDDTQTFSQPLPHINSPAINQVNLENCADSVQMLCYHFDQNVAVGQRMLERDCHMRHRSDEGLNGSTGYISCKVDAGVSGCSPVCVQSGGWLNLGVFSKGLQRHRSDTHPQQVGAFRIIDGEFADALSALKLKYGIEQQ